MCSAFPAIHFFLILADYDRRFFSVEGPMIDAQPWVDAALHARNQQRRIECSPAGLDRETLATNYYHTFKLAGVPPGSIVRPRR